ncbi:hypothetical protein [Vagococcus acidifermentans]|uniref:hypothetical protein n=1 Tax=Vagococcus acidifermentans TaxID=564710 RepID=UPI00319E8B9B
MIKKGDVVWGGTLLLIVLLFLIPDSRSVIIALTESSPYISGFVKFAILATMGDLMGNRIVTGTYVVTADVFWRMIVWGVIGCMVTLVFPVYMGGASVAQDGGLLPFAGVKPMQAFFGSAIMNLTFAPAMNTFHRVLDGVISARAENRGQAITLRKILAGIDWQHFVVFNWLKVGIFFWIPVHTIVFLLPGNIQVMVAAFSSIALGIILSFAARKQ